jgi:hypothetical protein
MTDWYIGAKLMGFRPLAIDSDGLVCHSQGALYRVGYDLKNPSFICDLPIEGLFWRLGRRLRIVDRIFRLTPNHGIIVEGNLFISRRSEIWRCELSTGKLSLDFVIPDNRRALEFSQVEQSNGEMELVFGEYFSNPTRQPVKIWSRSSRSGTWTVRGEFAVGEIEHVHSVTAVGKNLFVLCGDFEQAASIWITDSDFSSIKPLVRGRQRYRAAWIAELGGRLFYATDTQLEPNYVLELCIDKGNWIVREITGIKGSSIYSGRGQGYQFFSTTVECGIPTGNFFRDIFENRRGPGILSSRCNIISIDSDGFCENLLTAEKDMFPFRLAQFGTFSFPTGEMPVDTVVAYGTALREFDDMCLILRK